MSKTALRPFHETIIDAIRTVTTDQELDCLATLIKATKIPKGHAEIIDAWYQRCQEMLSGNHGFLGVLPSLRRQKQEAEAKTASEKKEINLDELQREIEKLRLLVKSYKLGSAAAYSEILNGLQNLNQQLVAQAPGK